MKNGMWAALVMLCAIFALGGGAAAQAPTPASPPEPLVDMTKISEPKVKEAIEEIGRKVAAINELYVAEFTPGDPLMPILSNNPAQVIMRRKGGFFMASRGMNRPHPQLTITDMWIMSDTKIFWTVTKGMGVDPKGGDQRIPVVIATKVDLDKMRAAGITNKMTETSGHFMEFVNPFGGLEPSTLKLSGETTETWTFTAKVLPNEDSQAHGSTVQVVTVSKQNGLPVKAATEGRVPVTATFAKVQVNPNPPVAESYFHFTPPAGAYVIDETDKAIQAAKSEGAKGEAAPPADPGK